MRLCYIDSSHLTDDRVSRERQLDNAAKREVLREAVNTADVCMQRRTGKRLILNDDVKREIARFLDPKPAMMHATAAKARLKAVLQADTEKMQQLLKKALALLMPVVMGQIEKEIDCRWDWHEFSVTNLLKSLGAEAERMREVWNGGIFKKTSLTSRLRRAVMQELAFASCPRIRMST